MEKLESPQIMLTVQNWSFHFLEVSKLSFCEIFDTGSNADQKMINGAKGIEG